MKLISSFLECAEQLRSVKWKGTCSKTVDRADLEGHPPIQMHRRGGQNRTTIYNSWPSPQKLPKIGDTPSDTHAHKKEAPTESRVGCGFCGIEEGGWH